MTKTYIFNKAFAVFPQHQSNDISFFRSALALCQQKYHSNNTCSRMNKFVPIADAIGTVKTTTTTFVHKRTILLFTVKPHQTHIILIHQGYSPQQLQQPQHPNTNKRARKTVITRDNRHTQDNCRSAMRKPIYILTRRKRKIFEHTQENNHRPRPPLMWSNNNDQITSTTKYQCVMSIQ